MLARSAVVCLKKWLEDFFQVFLRNPPAGILDLKTQRDRVAERRAVGKDGEPDIALVGELERIPAQVDQDFLELSRRSNQLILDRGVEETSED